MDRGHGKATLQQTIASIDERCRSPQITMWDLYRFNIHPWKVGVSASAALRCKFDPTADLLELFVYFCVQSVLDLVRSAGQKNGCPAPGLTAGCGAGHICQRASSRPGGATPFHRPHRVEQTPCAQLSGPAMCWSHWILHTFALMKLAARSRAMARFSFWDHGQGSCLTATDLMTSPLPLHKVALVPVPDDSTFLMDIYCTFFAKNANPAQPSIQGLHPQLLLDFDHLCSAHVSPLLDFSTRSTRVF